MCGILTIIGQDPGNDHVVRMRDSMTHRGPDGAGLWRGTGLVMAHRRLAVIDTSDKGLQPMHSADGRHALVYNGELYNEPQLREAIGKAEESYRSLCDTETLIELLACSGAQAIDALRGMFAFVWADLTNRKVYACRDQLGVKPLYWARTGHSITIASEIPAILAHPEFLVQPDNVGISGYLTTARVELDDRTMFDGVRVVRPGEILAFDLDNPLAQPERRTIKASLPRSPATPHEIRHAIEQSVLAHLRTDVPICSLLSGGLDSTIIASVAAPALPGLRTYCAGAESESGDPSYARSVAAEFGTQHTEAIVDRDCFLSMWQNSVALQGLPMCTPNEVAIRTIARALRNDGCVVALTGEGADELFAGYEMPMRLAAEHVQAGNNEPGKFQLLSNAWMPPEMKQAVLMPELFRSLEGDAVLFETFERLYMRAAGGTTCELGAHLNFHRNVNLVGLLRRLDSATMLERVESRTPFADREVLSIALSVPLEQSYDPRAEPVALRTKRALREAFRGRVSDEIISREKASFPLPFQSWIAGATDLLKTSGFARQLFTPAAIHTVASDPTGLWNLAWPMMNLAIWGDRWWGSTNAQVMDAKPNIGLTFVN
ncbi:MAG: asparagine synthase (glutamine-hydrolyzing) [Phycisphaera sp.]|nr:MAG: asparagine synthase (glutamine-hydrolyzing) [Phycisphaera sp.]